MSKRIDQFIKTVDRGFHYTPPKWFKNDLATLKAIATIYARTGAKPRGWGRITFTIPISFLQSIPRRPRGPISQNYGFGEGNYRGRDWNDLVNAVKKRKGWLGSGPLYVDIDPGGLIAVAEGNHRIQALTEAFGKTGKITVPVEIGDFLSRRRKFEEKEMFIIPASVKPGQFKIRAKGSPTRHSKRLRTRKINRKKAIEQREKTERAKRVEQLLDDIGLGW